mgnify:CR=1 FL=1
MASSMLAVCPWRIRLSATQDQDLLKTPLHALHVAQGARMVPFAGYSMPVQYPAGLMAEQIVIGLEIIRIDHQQCERRALTQRALPFALDGIVEIAPVLQAGQPVRYRQRCKFFLGCGTPAHFACQKHRDGGDQQCEGCEKRADLDGFELPSPVDIFQ